MRKPIIIFFALSLLIACKKDVVLPETQKESPEPLAYLYGGNGTYDAHFYIRNVGSVKEQETVFVQFAAEAKGIDGMQSDLGSLNITTSNATETVLFRGSEFDFPYKAEGLDEAFLRATSTIVLTAQGNAEFDTISSNVQAVDHLFLSSPLKEEQISSASSIQVAWNAQESSNGVGIFVELLQEESGDEYPQNTYPNHISREIITDDDGSYTLTTSDLTDFPEQGVLRIWVGRGNYTSFSTATGKACVLACYSLDMQRVIRY